MYYLLYGDQPNVSSLQLEYTYLLRFAKPSPKSFILMTEIALLVDLR